MTDSAVRPSDSSPTLVSRGIRRIRSGFLDTILDSPLAGLAPWILFSVVEGPGRLELSGAVALGLAAIILSLNWIRGGTPKLLEYSDVVYFTLFTVVVAFASDPTRDWLERWGGEMANIALVVIVVGSIVIRRPFTLQYAKEGTDPEVWDTPGFLKVNYQITWVWAVAFIIQAASGFYGDWVLGESDNIWTGWIIQIWPLIIAAQFTIWYPERLHKLAVGDTEHAPTVRDFLATVTPGVTVVGIISISADAAAEWFSIALIVGGILATRVLSRPPDDASTGESVGARG